jgi:C1A family cysteine protease
MGAVGTHNAKDDTWVLTPEIARDIYLRPQFGGHEMVITGYDDNAASVDDQGREHKGLFTLRNSWGDQFGDKGNFYMSYDYFKVLSIEVQRIRAIEMSSDDEENGTATA